MWTWRDRARWGVVLLVVLALPGLGGERERAGARAESAPAVARAVEWPTSEFKVVHRRPQSVSLPNWEQLLSELVSSKEESAVNRMWSDVIERYLRDAAGKYQAAGFEAPLLNRTRDIADGRLKYVLYLGQFDRESDPEIQRARGFYRDYLAINRPAVGGPGESLGPPTDPLESAKLYSTLAHELFHAIQGAYRRDYRSLPNTHRTQWHQTVNEGMADGAAVYLTARRFPGFLEHSVSTAKYLGGYIYEAGFLTNDRLLPDAWEPLNPASPYHTSSFWLHLAERFGSLSVLEYLMRHQPLPSLEPTREELLRWLDDGLRKHPGIKERLYTVYPHFLAELASYGGRRYQGVTEDEWRKWVVGGCTDDVAAKAAKLDLNLTPENNVVRRVMPLARMGVGCVTVTWKGFQEHAALKVEVRDEDKGVVEQIHLGLVGSTYSGGSCWKYVSANRRSSCVQEQVMAPEQSAEGWWRKGWQLPPAGYGAEGNGTFILANAALDPWETRVAPRVELYFSFQLTEDHTGRQKAPSEGLHLRLPNPAGPHPPAVDRAGESVEDRPSYWHYRTYGINPDPPVRDTLGLDLLPMTPIVIPKGTGPRAIEGARYIVTPHPGKPVPLGYTGPLYGFVLYEEPADPTSSGSALGAVIGKIGSPMCPDSDKRPIGQVLANTKDLLKVRVQTDLCTVRFGARRPTVVERLDVTVSLPFGWRYQQPAPRVEITPGVDYYVLRYFARLEGRLEGDWPFGNPKPDITPGTAGGQPEGGSASGGTATSAPLVKPCDCSCAGYEAMQKRMDELKRKGDAAARAEASALMPCLKQCLMQWTACRR
jgi:hypothetical protein